MLGKIMDTLSVAVGAGKDATGPRRPSQSQAQRGEVLIRGRPHRLVALDRHRFVADGYHGDLVVRQKFACMLVLDGFRLSRPLVCMAMVERIEEGRLLAVYLPDNTRDRADLDAWWRMRGP
ncbi:MAG TPA: hypothetical protein VD995_06340 [Azospirillum sp.]|nr:hypothetical protein [Azospirillum sp.]